MAKINRHILRNVDVKAVSLCDRGANRTPFRVMKRDAREGEMNMFKNLFGSKVEKKAAVVAIAVDKSADKLALEATIKEAGYSVEKFVETDDANLYMQIDGDLPGETLAVKFDDTLAVLVADVAKDALPETFEKDMGFYLSPGLVIRGMDLSVDAMKSAAEYTEKMHAGFPTEMFKLDHVLKDKRNIASQTGSTIDGGQNMEPDLKDAANPADKKGHTIDGKAPYDKGPSMAGGSMNKGDCDHSHDDEEPEDKDSEDWKQWKKKFDTAAKTELDLQAVIKETVTALFNQFEATFAQKFDDARGQNEALEARVKKSEDANKRLVATLKGMVHVEPEADKAPLTKTEGNGVSSAGFDTAYEGRSAE
jgi:hypothetical protein